MKQTKLYEVTLPTEPQALMSDHLALGGHNPSGEHISFTSYYMLRNDRPVIPVMGEFHFSRYDRRYWDDALLKIKGGGIDILATYVFWNHIEEDEGIYNWSGNNDVRHFVETCHQHDLEVIVRIGPFAHGECRNGGFPDWLYGQPFLARSNDTRYLALVKRWYDAIAHQLNGLLFKDGGPIVGVQLENEYMHAGAPWEVTFRPGTEWIPAGSDGVSHIVKLKELALEVGLDVPIYTATGWLRSPIIEDELLPMQGGYAFTPWSPDPDYVQPPTREFLFRNRHLHPVLGGEPTYDSARYPYACCEIGGGIQITYHHRPVVPPESVQALALMNLAGGANLIGYYMYHGGTNPIGEHSYMNEFTVPRLSYDFQAPIREFGQISASYRYLRLLHMFLHDFGEKLALMSVVLPLDQLNIQPEDNESLRYMLRSDGYSAYIFLNNYQDHVEMQDLEGIRLSIQTSEKPVTLPHEDSFTLKRNVSAILPLGLSLGGIQLEYATVQPLCFLAEEQCYVFFAPAGMLTEYAFDSTTVKELSVDIGSIYQLESTTYVNVSPDPYSLIKLETMQNESVHILTLTREQAEMCSKQHLFGKDRLIVSDATVIASDDELILYSMGKERVEVASYPPLDKGLASVDGHIDEQKDGLFTRYSLELMPKEIEVDIQHINPGKAIIRLDDDVLTGCHNVILQIDYVGDMGQAFCNGKLLHDNFYNGTIWEIGLGQIARDVREILLIVTPLKSSSRHDSFVPTGMTFRPDEASFGRVNISNVRAIPEYRTTIKAVDP
ncbi:MAG: glycosyl hydrolase family 35 [Anaerolineaceae bacterium]|nr:glycosyl hydrolase family 35 [Anaerolineaceae bacterium]